MDTLHSPPARRGWLRGRFVKRRERWSLTWVAKVLLLIFGVGLGWGIGWNAHHFLSINKPVAAEVVVIEGWIPDYALDEAVVEFRRSGYRQVYTCGGITRDGWNDTPKSTSADWAVSRLRRRGLTNVVVSVPCLVERADRTYHSALALRHWLDLNKLDVRAVNVVTLGAHARRTRLLFQKALGDQVDVGVIAVESRDYDPEHWWRSSDGAREVVGEMIAYLYARIFFWPTKDRERGQQIGGGSWELGPEMGDRRWEMGKASIVCVFPAKPSDGAFPSGRDALPRAPHIPFA